MSGVSNHLQAIGPMDAFLSVDPEVTHFRQQYSRHHHFVRMEYNQTLTGLTFGASVSAQFHKKGDAVTGMKLRLPLPKLSLTNSSFDTFDEFADAIPASTNGFVTTYGETLLRAAYADAAALTETHPIINQEELYPMWVNGIGFHIISDFHLQIGAHTYDKMDGRLMFILDRLLGLQDSRSAEQMAGYFCRDSKIEEWRARRDFARAARVLNVPIPFNFAMGWSECLHVLPIQQVDIHVTITLRPATECTQFIIARHSTWMWLNSTVGKANPYTIEFHTVPTYYSASMALTDGTNMPNSSSFAFTETPSLVVSFLFFSEEERDDNNTRDHVQLIRQHQTAVASNVAAGATTHNYTVTHNHPTLAHIWVYQSDCHTVAGFNDDAPTGGATQLNANNHGDFWAYNNRVNDPSGNMDQAKIDPISTVQLQLNGQDRILSREGSYFRSVTLNEMKANTPQECIYAYPYALDIKAVEPTGSFNQSRVDNVQYIFGLANMTRKVHMGMNATDVTNSATAGSGALQGNIHFYSISWNVSRTYGGHFSIRHNR